MAKARTLVVDTNVFRAAGESEAPDSVAARELLEQLRKYRHQIAWCDELDQEFWKHASRFSSRWVTQMQSRGRRVDCKLENPLHLPCQECGFTEDEKREAEKDRFLLDLALTVDRLIASFERRAPGLFRRLAAKNKKIQKLGWAHPGGRPFKLAHSSEVHLARWLASETGNLIEPILNGS